MQPKESRAKYLPLVVFQIILMVLFFIFVRYGTEDKNATHGFEDTHVMIFIGFGFLMTFLKKYCYSALGLNLLLSALVIQWAILCQNFFDMENNTIIITKKHLLEADIMAATILISFGALLGIASATQLLFLAIIETVLACVNINLVSKYFKAADVGGSIAIHTFGAYFGLGASLALNFKTKKTEAAATSESTTPTLNGPSYVSDVTAMIGSIFLWIYWPSFNSGLAVTDAEYQRCVINTYLSLAASTVTTFVMSSIIYHGKFEMVHIQNSTLAGGVAAGSVCNLMIESGPGTAIPIGMGAGIISVLGYAYLSPRLEKMGIPDTCGVNNLHGMPGVYSGLLSIIFAAIATKESYGSELGTIFVAMDGNKTADFTPRTGPQQGLFQFIALIVTLTISFGGGLITGILAKTSLFKKLSDEEKFNDEPNWELPS